MSRKAKKYLFDIILAIELIDEFMVGIESFEEYEKDIKTMSAVERQLGIIGEAVTQFRKLKPDKEINHVRQIIDFRNRLIHAYFNVDATIVWKILKTHLPILKEEVNDHLEK